MPAELRVKLTTSFPQWPILRQTPGWSGMWGGVRFHVDDATDECDYWVVYDGPVDPVAATCPPENVIYFTAEPPSLRHYPDAFLRQFGRVITCHRRVRHPRVTFRQQALPWHVGVAGYHSGEGPRPASLDYDKLKAATSADKPRCLAVISSSKTATKGHRRRLAFVHALRERLGDRVDVFGHGIREIADKWDAIAPYRYHIAIENSRVPDYWTEKLADAFLGDAHPFYDGCPNAGDYFPAGSFTPIDVGDFRASVGAIERAIAEDAYDRTAAARAEARRLVLDEYNLFAEVARLCTAPSAAGASPARPITLQPRTRFSGGIAGIVHAVARRLPAGIKRMIK
jgi:hypothetical protein